MSTENKADKPQATISYYGKKLYVLNPAIAWVKPTKDQHKLFMFEDIEDKATKD